MFHPQCPGRCSRHDPQNGPLLPAYCQPRQRRVRAAQPPRSRTVASDCADVVHAPAVKTQMRVRSRAMTSIRAAPSLVRLARYTVRYRRKSSTSSRVGSGLAFAFKMRANISEQRLSDSDGNGKRQVIEADRRLAKEMLRYAHATHGAIYPSDLSDPAPSCLHQDKVCRLLARAAPITKGLLFQIELDRFSVSRACNPIASAS